MRDIGPHVELLADAEGFDVITSVTLRLKEIQNDKRYFPGIEKET